MITAHGMNTFTEAIADKIKSAKVIVDGIEIPFELYRKSIEGNSFQVFLLLSNLIEGEVKDFQLLDNAGETLVNKMQVVNKTSERGLLVRFNFTLKEVVM